MGPLEEWHAIVDSGDLERLGDLLADDVVFHSPVLHAPVEGRDTVALYLAGAHMLLVNDAWRYVRQIVGDRDAMLEFVTEVDGLHVNGVDVLRWDEDGRIVDFKVMIRPRKALDAVQARISELLAG